MLAVKVQTRHLLVPTIIIKHQICCSITFLQVLDLRTDTDYYF